MVESQLSLTWKVVIQEDAPIYALTHTLAFPRPSVAAVETDQFLVGAPKSKKDMETSRLIKRLMKDLKTLTTGCILSENLVQNRLELERRDK